MIPLTFTGFTSDWGIAMTQYYLWSILSSEILQWDITTNVFTATFNKSIAYPSGFTTSSGAVALNDDVIIMVNDQNNPQEVVEMNITSATGVATTMFNLQTDRVAKGNMLYTTNNKFVIINTDSISGDTFITQYDYLTGTIEVDLNIGTIEAKVLYECECVIFVLATNGELYSISTEVPYELVPLVSTSTGIISATQVRTCVPVSLTDNGNLTTTTTTTTI